MVNWNSYWYYMIIFFLIILLCIVQPSSAYISCYECTNCSQPFAVNSVTQSSTTCNACYKLAITIAYAPFQYVIRKCVPACLETSQTFGGGSVISSCCASSLCNTSSIITFPQISRFFLFIFIILNFLKYSFY